MAGDHDKRVTINGYQWIDVTDQTTSSTEVYTFRQILSVDGDPRRAREELPTTNE